MLKSKIKFKKYIYIILSLILVSISLISCEKKDKGISKNNLEDLQNSLYENEKEVRIKLNELGSWKNGKINEKGERIFLDGRVYLGEWKNGKPNGNGELTVPDLWDPGFIPEEGEDVIVTINYDLVEKYNGEWRDGKRHGFGKTTWATEDYYEGEYKNDIRNGKGTLFGHNWGEYNGGWKNNKTHGEGTLTLLDGEKWIGEFKEGVISKITVFDKDGKKSKGNINGLLAITKLLDATPYADGAYEITATKGERMGLDIIYDMEW